MESTQDLIQEPSIIIDKAYVMSSLFIEKIIEFGPRVILAVILWIVGLKLIKILGNLVETLLVKSHVDTGLRTFLGNLVNFGLKILLVLTVLSTVGVETTSFIAVVGATGLAIGLALQGSLSNFAGGVMILLFRPFKVGDFIETQSIMGTVQSISIFNSTLLTPEKRTTIVPNGSIINNVIKNFSKNPFARVDIHVGISYSADLALAKKVLQELLDTHPSIRKEDGYGVYVNNLGDSAVELIVRGFCDSPQFLDIYYDMTEKVKLTLDRHKIEIPFPQRVVHMRDG